MNLNRLFKINNTEQRYIDGGTGHGLLIANTILTGIFVWAVLGYLFISGKLSEGLINKFTLLPIYSVGLYVIWGITNAIVKKWIPYESVTFISAVSFIICGYNGYVFARGICIIKDGIEVVSDRQSILDDVTVKLWMAFVIVVAIYSATGFIPAAGPYSRMGFLWLFNVFSPLVIVALVFIVFKVPTGETAVEAIIAPLKIYELIMGYLAARYAFKFVLHIIIGDIPPEGWDGEVFVNPSKDFPDKISENDDEQNRPDNQNAGEEQAGKYDENIVEDPDIEPVQESADSVSGETEGEEIEETTSFSTFEFESVIEDTEDFTKELLLDSIDFPLPQNGDVEKLDDDVVALLEQIQREELR